MEIPGYTQLPLVSQIIVEEVAEGTYNPPTQTKIIVALTQFDEEDEVKNLVSSLRKFLEKKKLVKSLEKTLTKVLDKM